MHHIFQDFTVTSNLNDIFLLMYIFSPILDRTKGCQIGCSILSTNPFNSIMSGVYKIPTIELHLVSVLHKYELRTSCWNYYPIINLSIGCEGDFIYSNVFFFKIQHFIN